MDTKTQIHKLKSKIKGLSREQKCLKRARKTSIPLLECRLLLAQGGLTLTTLSPGKPEDAWLEVERRRLVITACLNLYHELRESEHRHGVAKADLYWYRQCEGSLRKEFLVTL